VKQKIRWFITLVFIATVTYTSGQRICADWDAKSFVDDFNNMNNGTGFKFSSRITNGSDSHNYPIGTVLLTNEDTDEPDLSAYKNSGFITFCIQPDIPNYAGDKWGKLSYNNNKTYSYSGDPNDPTAYPLYVGVAYLYKVYITGELDIAYQNNDFVTEDLRRDVGKAIHQMMTFRDYSNNAIVNWVEKKLNSETYTIYDPAKTYSFMDDYYVFIMNVLLDPNGDPDDYDNHSQDFLYITRWEEPPHAPEPATILFWTLGIIGTACYARRRSRL